MHPSFSLPQATGPRAERPETARPAIHKTPPWARRYLAWCLRQELAQHTLPGQQAKALQARHC